MVVCGVMIQVLRHGCQFAFALALLLVSPVAMAGGDSTATAIRELATNADFRVRTQAALSLGASDDAKAVEPLCRALDDSKSAVRAAAAAALGKLGKGGQDCLSEREAKETADSVKVAIQKAIKALEAGSGGAAECVIDGKTRYYVSIGKTLDNTQRKKSKVPELVRSSLAKTLFAPEGILHWS